MLRVAGPVVFQFSPRHARPKRFGLWIVLLNAAQGQARRHSVFIAPRAEPKRFGIMRCYFLTPAKEKLWDRKERPEAEKFHARQG
ncbi:MAG: hypothetical protein P4K78_03575 [Terracidiphilus sp.]|nr:hypothetical protein [Terracidiphilus sp.]